MWFLRVCLCVVLLSGSIFAGSADSRVPVIVELFTSEGCSSCPPADAVLARLQRNQPVSDARIIVLSEHVDYWNNLGWVDPFSSPQFRARQNDYARAFGTENVYTPQMIVNGRVEFVGDDFDRASAEVQRAANQPQAVVELQPYRNRKDRDLIDLAVQIKDLPPVKVGAAKDGAPIQVYMAITEDNLASDVQRGENGGHRLRHTAVVRSFGVIGTIDPREKASLSIKPTLKFPANWKRQDLHAVVFVQEARSQRILGSAISDLN